MFSWQIILFSVVFLVTSTYPGGFGQLFSLDDSDDGPFRCSFDGEMCSFGLIEPSGVSALPDSLKWRLRLPDGSDIFNHSFPSKNSGIIYASGGQPGSTTVLETSSQSMCATEYCCFSALLIMRQEVNAVLPGSVAFYHLTRETKTVIGNLSFAALGNSYWANFQQTFRSPKYPFKVGIEGRNGDGDGYLAGIDDIMISPGMCKNDVPQVGTRPGLCDPPPGVAAGQASIALKNTSSLVKTGTYVSYSCDLGYDLIGIPQSQCLDDGRWTTPPVCAPYRNSNAQNKNSRESRLAVSGIQMEEAENNLPSSILISDCKWGPQFSGNIPSSKLTVTSSSQLYLFPDNPIKCSGTLVRWVAFIAPTSDSAPIYLSIWRPVNNKRMDSYMLVGINQVTSPSQDQLLQFVVPGDQRIEVEAGDIVGLIYKKSSKTGIVYMYDEDHLGEGMKASDLYNAVPDTAKVHIEDNPASKKLAVRLDRANQRRLLPLLQAFVGRSDCTPRTWNQVTFAGLSTIAPGVTTDIKCWEYCRRQPSCVAVTFNSDSSQCIVFSYISSEIHFSANNVSLANICQSDCGTKLLSTTQSDFGIIVEGTRVDSPRVRNGGLQEADCELACRYTPSCLAFTYEIPFRNCTLLSNVAAIRRKPNQRSFRKWGCTETNAIDDCGACVNSFQCRDGSVCQQPFENGDIAQCVPLTNITKCDRPAIVARPQCGEAPALQNGYVLLRGVNDGQRQVTYACSSGFKLVGNSVITCIDDIWQARPRCEPACTGLPVIDNGRVEEVLPALQNSNRQGRVICNRGFILVGNPVVICMEAKWSDGAVCVPNCGQPPVSDNCSWSVAVRMVGVPITVRYSPIDGYILQGNNTLRCDSGTWSSPAPICRKILPTVSCPAAPTVTNGMIAGTAQSGTTKFTTYSCLNGFELVGSAIITCSSNQWDMPPTCTANCGPIPFVLNSRFTILVMKNSQPYRVRYDCYDGFNIVGNQVITCASSLWSNPPQCSQKEMRRDYCGQPPAISNGLWRPTFTMGEATIVAEYSCYSDYSLIGPVRLTCSLLPSGVYVWAPGILPQCRPAAIVVPQTTPLTVPIQRPILSPFLIQPAVFPIGNPGGSVLTQPSFLPVPVPNQPAFVIQRPIYIQPLPAVQVQRPVPVNEDGGVFFLPSLGSPRVRVQQTRPTELPVSLVQHDNSANEVYLLPTKYENSDDGVHFLIPRRPSTDNNNVGRYPGYNPQYAISGGNTFQVNRAYVVGVPGRNML